MARKRRSGSRLVTRPQASTIEDELQRRYGAVAFQIRAVPSQEAPTTCCEVGSKCATRTTAVGPSSIVTGIPVAASVTATEPLELAVAISDEVRSNSTERTLLRRWLLWFHSLADAASQTCTAPSPLPAAMSRPSGENATAVIASPSSRR